MKPQFRAPDLNQRFWHFFDLSSELTGFEFRIHCPTPDIDGTVWATAEDEDDPDRYVSGVDSKYLEFPQLNIPFPFRKRQ